MIRMLTDSCLSNCAGQTSFDCVCAVFSCGQCSVSSRKSLEAVEGYLQPDCMKVSNLAVLHDEAILHKNLVTDFHESFICVGPRE